MMNTAIVGIVDFCARGRWIVVVAGILLLLGTANYAAARFSINADVEGLISESLSWHERQVQLTQALPQRGISAVVSAPTAENAEIATNELSGAVAPASSEGMGGVAEIDPVALFSHADRQ